METSTNSYRLNQGKKEFIFSTSIIGNKIRLSCQNTNNINNRKYTRDFTMEEFRELDYLFNFIKTPHHASEYIDRVLRNQKVGINDENDEVVINFYIKTDGITHRINIPLVDQLSNNENDINKYFENIGMSSTKYYSNENLFKNNYDINQYFGADTNAQYNQNIETNPINKYANISQKTPIPQYQNYFETPNVTSANNNMKQIINPGYSNKIEMHKFSISPSSPNIYLNNRQFVLNQNVVTSPLIHSPKMKVEDNSNIDDRIQKLLQEQNIIINDDFTQAKTEEGNKQIDSPRKPLTNVLPIQSTTKVLPPIGPYTSYAEPAFQKSPEYNFQINNNSVFQNVQSGDEFINSVLKTPTHSNVSTTNKKIEANISKTSNINQNLNIQNNNINSFENRKVIDEEVKKLRSENLVLKKKLAELEPLKMKVAEMDVLKGQLAELNILRAQVAEYISVKGQLKEIDNLKAQLEQMNILKSQLSQFNLFKKKAEEVDKLKLKIKELEEIRNKNEEEIKNLRENLLYYSIKSQQNNNDSKDDISEEDDIIKGNIIHDTDELEMLTRKINKDNKKLTLNLLYKATADSDKAAAFHAKCDEANSSIVLVETDKGKRFGGYTTCSWSGDCVDKKDKNAFVFSLDKMETYDIIPEEDAIGCYPKFGPIFLGCQIRIYDKAFSKGGTTFERGLNYDTKEDFELTGGERVFNVKEIEVYEVVFE